ncbi:hypothetical protein ADUPG1_006580 [Aduncisulcus paluster]|uniref:Uncharacterized protein n=1 Tax=Aduncisulcus paluster TaxID=2918883 RepID=A0ABQ5KIR2_9EUKA|nr:hypothetical protein ADUPG1_006580 [Aduncisulcus paluster]
MYPQGVSSSVLFLHLCSAFINSLRFQHEENVIKLKRIDVIEESSSSKNLTLSRFIQASSASASSSSSHNPKIALSLSTKNLQTPLTSGVASYGSIFSHSTSKSSKISTSSSVSDIDCLQTNLIEIDSAQTLVEKYRSKLIEKEIFGNIADWNSTEKERGREREREREREKEEEDKYLSSSSSSLLCKEIEDKLSFYQLKKLSPVFINVRSIPYLCLCFIFGDSEKKGDKKTGIISFKKQQYCFSPHVLLESPIVSKLNTWLKTFNDNHSKTSSRIVLHSSSSSSSSHLILPQISPPPTDILATFEQYFESQEYIIEDLCLRICVCGQELVITNQNTRWKAELMKIKSYISKNGEISFILNHLFPSQDSHKKKEKEKEERERREGEVTKLIDQEKSKAKAKEEEEEEKEKEEREKEEEEEDIKDGSKHSIEKEKEDM